MKKVFKLLNKYNKNYLIKQNENIKSMKSLKKDFEKQGLYKKVNDDFDYIEFTILRTSYENMKSIQNSFFEIKESLRELWEVVSYAERKFLLYNELEAKVSEIKYFIFDDKKILISYFDDLINAYYNHDILMFENEAFRKYLYDFEKIVNLENDFGILPHQAGFAEIDYIKGDKDKYIMYNKAMRRFYMVDNNIKSSFGLLSVISDQEMIDIADLVLADDKEGFINYLIDNDLSKKRLLKKLKKIQKKFSKK